ncbi:MAG: radical SAM protein, partial [Desulfobacterales bacterium]
ASCDLQCDHCGGKILDAMTPTITPEALVETCQSLERRGNHGVLISGGCSEDGDLPLAEFAPAIRQIKDTTGLMVSIHSGCLTDQDAVALKEAGVDQALIDVVGDEETFRKVYHVSFGLSSILSSMASLQKAGLPMIPHIVCGLDYGHIKGEKNAVDMISRFTVQHVVIVSLMGIPGTPMGKVIPPKAQAVADIIVETRLKMPDVFISLGCARQRGNTEMEVLAIDAGVNRMAIPSDEAIERALYYELDISYQKTCCSVSDVLSRPAW